MPIAAIAAIGIGSAIVGGVSASKAANTAANAQKQATDQAVEESRRQYDQNRADQAPWMQAGGKAINELANRTLDGGDLSRTFTANDFQKDPGYDFRMQEGAKALERSAAARGSVLGGAQLKALTRYNSDFASNEYMNAYNRFNNDQTQQYNRIAGISGAGQNSTNSLQNANTALSNNIAGTLYNGISGAGATRASGYLGVGNAINSGLSGIQNLLAWKYMQGQQQQGGGGGYV